MNADHGGRGAPDELARAPQVLTARLVFGLVLVTLGILWTLDNLGLHDASATLRWWGVVPLGWGLCQLLGIGMPARRTGGAIWIIVGTVALLHSAGLVALSVGDLWPLILIFIGARIVARRWTGGGVEMGENRHALADESMSTFSLWAGNEYKVVSPAFRGGDVSAVMAGATVDLRATTLAGGRATLEVFTIWGGIEIVVPRGWRVQSEVTPVMAGYEDSTVPSRDPNAPLLVVRGFALMGGVEVVHRSPGKDGDAPAEIVHRDDAEASPPPPGS